jgi:hypothetical protein
VCNKVVRTILRGDEKAVQALVEDLVQQRTELVVDENSDLFFESLLCMLKHGVHPQAHKLRGTHLAAYSTILKYIEDAGLCDRNLQKLVFMRTQAGSLLSPLSE